MDLLYINLSAKSNPAEMRPWGLSTPSKPGGCQYCLFGQDSPLPASPRSGETEYRPLPYFYFESRTTKDCSLTV